MGHTHIGDILYRTCSLPALREHLPDCEWSYAVTPGTAEVLQGNPHVREILPVIEGENSWDLTDGGFEIGDAELRWEPNNETEVDAEKSLANMRLQEALEELDDVQTVASNLLITEAVVAAFESA